MAGHRDVDEIEATAGFAGDDEAAEDEAEGREARTCAGIRPEEKKARERKCAHDM